MAKKYCYALVVMLYNELGYSHKRICEVTGYKSSAVGNIISRRIGTRKERGHVVRAKKYELNIEAIEAEYINGASTYELGEKYDIPHAYVSELMLERGHTRGRGHGPACERANNKKRNEADARLIEELGCVPISEIKDHQCRRELRMALRKRDFGVTWKALAKRNGSMKCEVCGIECNPNDKTWVTHGPTHPSVDHIIRICDGGTDTFENTRLVCCSCNFKLNIQAEKEGKTHAEEQAITNKCA